LATTEKNSIHSDLTPLREISSSQRISSARQIRKQGGWPAEITRLIVMTTSREFLKFAKGVLQNYRALTVWVRRTGRGRGWISVRGTLSLREKADAKARAVFEVKHLIPEILAAQLELDKAIEERRSRERADFFSDHPKEEEVGNNHWRKTRLSESQ
jgi:hypothetical protein